MPKILYIPTGEYLKFYSGKYPNWLKETSIEALGGSLESKVEFLVNDSNFYPSSDWVETNKVVLPILRSELEIIYD